ncbi:MAG: DNA methyltransferase [Candidatus Thorarchaeota archaeon]
MNSHIFHNRFYPRPTYTSCVEYYTKIANITYQFFILSSSFPRDVIFDSFAGSGTTLVCAKQLNCSSIGIELGKKNYDMIMNRLQSKRSADGVNLEYYRFTEDLDTITGSLN